jgi:hypothetical protein
LKYDFDANPKPWMENKGQDMDKYFNYGFTEETWCYYAREVLNKAHLSTILSKRSDLQNTQLNHMKKNSQLNFVLPHQMGGFGDPDPPQTYSVTVTEEVKPDPDQI